MQLGETVLAIEFEATLPHGDVQALLILAEVGILERRTHTRLPLRCRV